MGQSPARRAHGGRFDDRLGAGIGGVGLTDHSDSELRGRVASDGQANEPTKFMVGWPGAHLVGLAVPDSTAGGEQRQCGQHQSLRPNHRRRIPERTPGGGKW
jgi:hypothetical protein